MEKNKEWKDEENYLNETLSAIDAELVSLNSSTAENKAFVKDLREYYVHGTEIFGGLDSAEQVELTQRIDELVDMNFQNIEKSELLTKNRNKPYFGRVQFKSKTLEDDFRIGLMGIEHDQRYFVYDWRAPICELFYDYGVGKASFRSPQGKIDGEIILKRQIEIENSKLIGIYEKDANLFDDYLQQILGRINTDKLHNIVATIQNEQNEIIRDLRNDVVIVQGYAGSGKTTVALHRIAYALYRLKELSSANILIFTLNEAFMSHISGVLPELGEQNTRSATIAKFLGRLLKFPRNFEESDAFLLRYSKAKAKERKEIEFKLDLNIKPKIVKWVKDLEDSLVANRGFHIKNQPISPKMLNRWFASDFSDLAIENRFNAIADLIMRKLKLKNRDSLFDRIREEICACFNYNFSLAELYSKFCVDCGLSTPQFEVVNFEDAILLAVLKSHLKDMVIKVDIRHILVDEAQEYPVLFIDFLLRLFPRANFTFLGDRYQQTNPFGVGDLNKIADLHAYFGDVKFYELDNSYRSSEEIVEYSSRIIGYPRHNAFRMKNSKPVKEIKLPNTIEEIAACVAGQISESNQSKETVGIIVGDSVSATKLFTKLKSQIKSICLIKDAHSVATQHIQVMPVALCKGLEFNKAIVIKDGGMFNSEFGTNLFYIACTRAINELVVIKE